MSIERDEAIININEAREKIITIKKKLEEKNDELPKLKDLKEQFENIYCILGKKQTDLQKDLKDLGVMIDKIKEKQVILLNEKTEVMVATIRANLPNGMSIEPENNDIKKGILVYENKNIGEIEITQNNDSIIVNVNINDSNQENFIVDDELGMYTIINHIITKFNYN